MNKSDCLVFKRQRKEHVRIETHTHTHKYICTRNEKTFLVSVVSVHVFALKFQKYYIKNQHNCTLKLLSCCCCCCFFLLSSSSLSVMSRIVRHTYTHLHTVINIKHMNRNNSEIVERRQSESR